MSNFQVFLKMDSSFYPAAEATSTPKLPSGSYTLNHDPESGKIWFDRLNIRGDELVDLPGTAYDIVTQDLKMFLTTDCKTRHDDVRILHKMNILLYGPPGTGKSCIVSRVSKEVISSEGIVLFNPDPRLLKDVYALFDKLQPETRVLIIFEELDQLIDDYEEGAFLHILDGELQKPNVLFIATTNYIDQIPMRIRRPGRFALRQYVGFPNTEARFAYLNSKLKNVEQSRIITDLTSGFSVDNLKEVVRATYCMKKDLDKVVKGLRDEFHIGQEGPVNPEELDDGGPGNPKGKKIKLNW